MVYILGMVSWLHGDVVIVGPTLWNNLPVAIRTTTSLSIFKVMLKSHLLDRFAVNQ